MTERFVPKHAAEARGRNAYFRVGEIELWWNPAEDALFIDVYSSRRGQAPPCRIMLAAEDADALARLIQKQCHDRLCDEARRSQP